MPPLHILGRQPLLAAKSLTLTKRAAQVKTKALEKS
jgi:hypothetical protein